VRDTETWFRIDDPSSAGAARLAATRLARRIGLGEARVGEVAIVVTEVATNLHRHARDGSLALRLVRDECRAGVGVVAVDSGPGMPDPERSRRDGYSTAGTLGVGLGAIERLSSWSDIATSEGTGTVVALELWDGPAPDRPPVAFLSRPMTGQEACGDAVSIRYSDDGRITVLAVDGLGHGPLAAQAADAAVRAFDDDDLGGPQATVLALHRAISGTRGAALAVTEIDRSQRCVTFAGVGNIAAWLVTDDDRRGLMSSPGIVGHQLRRVQEQRVEVAQGARVVLHSDGLTSKWQPFPTLLRRDPLLAAAALLRDAGVRHDDASVTVAEASWRS
jgi:anti-sigma regulatory factor (Ser/Thr protein kinase)